MLTVLLRCCQMLVLCGVLCGVVCAVVPAGYYLNGTRTVVPCPKGQYRTKGTNDKECVNCPPGTTTAAEASTNVTACSKPLP